MLSFCILNFAKHPLYNELDFKDRSKAKQIISSNLLTVKWLSISLMTNTNLTTFYD